LTRRAHSRCVALALALCLSAAAQARASEKESVLRACEREFGAAVDARENLFEVNASFVLQAKFDARGDYADLGVRFVHVYFEHEVAGVVTRKYRCGRSFIDGYPAHVLLHVTVGGCGYFVGRRTFARLRVGRRARFRATGPMGGRCGARNTCGR
jgi:hypothetical protein